MWCERFHSRELWRPNRANLPLAFGDEEQGSIQTVQNFSNIAELFFGNSWEQTEKGEIVHQNHSWWMLSLALVHPKTIRVLPSSRLKGQFLRLKSVVVSTTGYTRNTPMLHSKLPIFPVTVVKNDKPPSIPESLGFGLYGPANKSLKRLTWMRASRSL